eukprot:m.13990 g.13990  ORF g.13990 m.13990 type:complete len:669 (+) comp3108_c0_seq1:126-2132(+)
MATHSCTSRRTTVIMSAVLSALSVSALASSPYNNTWESLDSRPNPAWWSDIKYSVSLHWGVYSVPSFSVAQSSSSQADPTVGTQPYSEWYWHNMGGPTGPDMSTGTGQFHKRVYGSDFTYQDFASQFRAELYNNATDWATLFRDNGVQLAVLTSKHHDGYELWPSAQSESWNSNDVGPRQDLVGAFLTSMRAAGLRAGVYHSVFEWFNPLYRGPNPESYVDNKLVPDLHDLANMYKPDVFLMDGEWEHNSTFWKTRDFLAWLFNDSPVKDTVVVDDRWGSETRGKHGGVYVCENGMFSPFCDGTGANADVSHPWVYWATQARSWGNSRMEDDAAFKGANFFVPLLARSVADGGSLMINLGPDASGRLPAIQSLTLRDMGDWLKVNGPAIYNARPRGATTTTPSTRGTTRGGATQAHTQHGLSNSMASSTPRRHRTTLTAPSVPRTEVVQKGDTFPLLHTGFTSVSGVPPGSNGGTASVIYAGNVTSASACQTACAKQTDCLAYTWFDDTSAGYSHMCYFRNTSGYALMRQAGALTGVRDFVQVYYTVTDKSRDPHVTTTTNSDDRPHTTLNNAPRTPPRASTTAVLNAIVSPYPPSDTLVLPSVTLVSGATPRATLLGVAPPSNGTLGIWPQHGPGQAGVVVAVPRLSPSHAPCRHAFTFVLEGVETE